jgi:hypothetical protein
MLKLNAWTDISVRDTLMGKYRIIKDLDGQSVWQFQPSSKLWISSYDNFAEMSQAVRYLYKLQSRRTDSLGSRDFHSTPRDGLD